MRKSELLKKSLAVALVFAISVILIPASNTDAAKRPELNKKEATVCVGKTVRLKVKNIKGKGKIKWKSSEKKVAAVSKKGLVKGRKAGKAVITAKTGKYEFRCNITVKAKEMLSAKGTGIKMTVSAPEEYSNWEGVSNVSEFTDSSGNYCFAYDGKKNVTVVRTSNGKLLPRKVVLPKHKRIFGAVACDGQGNYYLVTGKTNKSSDVKNTVFVSKFDSAGRHIKTVGDDGSSSLASYYDKTFYTSIPFDGGNCDIAINGNYLAVNYAREMYSGHQSNSVLIIDTRTMQKVKPGDIYSSHSFAQRALPFGNGFLFASEGDCFSRAFTLSLVLNPDSGLSADYDTFHFGVKKNTYKDYIMSVLNNNFAHLGGLVKTGNMQAALVGTSAKSLTSGAAKENEQLFVQIADFSGIYETLDESTLNEVEEEVLYELEEKFNDAQTEENRPNGQMSEGLAGGQAYGNPDDQLSAGGETSEGLTGGQTFESPGDQSGTGGENSESAYDKYSALLYDVRQIFQQSEKLPVETVMLQLKDRLISAGLEDIWNIARDILLDPDNSRIMSGEVQFITSGKRTGYSGGNGDERVTDRGVKWLTSYSKKYTISHPQAVSDSRGNIIILYELYKSGRYLGVYHMVLNSRGKVIKPVTRCSSTALLNPCETPVCVNNRVFWTGNKTTGEEMYVFRLKI